MKVNLTILLDEVQVHFLADIINLNLPNKQTNEKNNNNKNKKQMRY